MKLLHRPFTRLSCILVIVSVGCTNDSSKSSKPPKVSPAKVTTVPNESNLTEITLTPKAYERLGISTARVERQSVAEVRNLGGEITVPPGESAAVVAPVAGTVQLSDKSPLPKPGSSVSRGRIIFKFVPLLTPERFVPTPAERAQIANAQASLISLQMTADGDVQQFAEQVTAARIALNRAVQLQKDRVGSERAVDDAKAQLALAEAGKKVASERKKVLDRLTADVEQGTVLPIPIESPIDGVVRALPVTLGQTVSSGTPLFEVVNLKTLWIRVPVYVGLINDLKLDERVTVRLFGDDGRESTFTAMPIEAPPTADPLSSSADLFYAISNEEGRFRPGERVSVAIPMNTEAESLVVPTNSVLYDIHGNTWVYSVVDQLHFRRVRVVVQRTTGDLAAIQSGPPEGTEVVVDGAAELFGTEFGTGK